MNNNSPCTNECEFSRELGFCLNCGRHAGQQRAWKYMNLKDREARLLIAKERLATVGE